MNGLQPNRSDCNYQNYNERGEHGSRHIIQIKVCRGVTLPPKALSVLILCESVSLNLPGAHPDNLVMWRPVAFWIYNFLEKCVEPWRLGEHGVGVGGQG